MVNVLAVDCCSSLMASSLFVVANSLAASMPAPTPNMDEAIRAAVGGGGMGGGESGGGGCGILLACTCTSQLLARCCCKGTVELLDAWCCSCSRRRQSSLVLARPILRIACSAMLLGLRRCASRPAGDCGSIAPTCERNFSSSR